MSLTGQAGRVNASQIFQPDADPVVALDLSRGWWKVGLAGIKSLRLADLGSEASQHPCYGPNMEKT